MAFSRKNRIILIVSASVGVIALLSLIVIIVMMSTGRTSKSSYVSHETHVADSRVKSEDSRDPGAGREVMARSSADAVVKKAETYYTLHGSYPRAIDDFDDYKESSLQGKWKVSDKTPTEETYDEVRYVSCSSNSAQVIYYSSLTRGLVVRSLGDASNSEACL